MRHFPYKLTIFALSLALVFSLAGNVYQHNKETAPYQISGTYCTKDPRQDGSGVYLAIYPTMAYSLYTQKNLYSKGTYEQYGEQAYKLTGADGQTRHALIFKDIAYVFQNDQMILILDKYDSIPCYLGP